ncbi:hypothetical protein GIB67_025845 [Kingdonia uniflora]|uniref:Transmembrane protein n=1 Tax=Kingdonia uniflora TaxID=39325 RepID=A0A7J7PBG9_9MAGN|nr:hypothetical protein GIB67_025845 [Kingdonia uniflora]
MEKDQLVDLETGGTTSEDEGNTSNVRQANKLLGRVWSGFVSLDGTIKEEYGVNVSSSADDEATEVLIHKKSGGEEKTSVLVKKIEREKRKKMGSKKPPKPPRPPKGPSLDAADQKLVREISELAMLKRARIERMKAQKKLKAGKASSSNSNLFAMLVTLLFCLVIIFQGMFSRSSSPVSFDGSPESSVAKRGGLISIQYYKNLSAASGTNSPDSGSPNLVEQISGSGINEEDVSRVAG